MDTPIIRKRKLTMRIKTLKLAIISLMIASIWSCSLHDIGSGKTATGTISINTGVKDASFLTEMEKEIILELNTARTSPKEYTDFLKTLSEKPQWSKGLDEAIRYIEKKEPLPPFKASKGLSLAAHTLVRDHGPEGLTGHISRDGKSFHDRMNIYGHPEGKIGEYLGYGYTEGAALVARMAIDEGSSGREQETYIFNNNFLVAGVACGPHKSYRVMCVIDFANSYKENTQ